MQSSEACRRIVAEDTMFKGEVNSGTALELVETMVDSLVVQLLPQTVQLISAKTILKVTEQILVELYLQSSTASLT